MRKQVAENLITASSDDNGWFYMIELLLRAEKTGVNVLDYPVEWFSVQPLGISVHRDPESHRIPASWFRPQP